MRNEMHRMCAAAVALLLGVVPVAGAQASGSSGKPATQNSRPEGSQSQPAQAQRSTPQVQRPPVPTTPPPAQPPPPLPGYLIGPDDELSILYWRDKDLSVDVQVRPDGKISLALLNDVDAAGLTPEQLRMKITELSKEFIEDPNVTVVVKEIKSRKVFITGMVAKQGPYPLTTPTTVLQLISLAGGLQEYANKENIRVFRAENGRPVSFKVNLKEVESGKKLQQNILLQPGDTVTVP